MDRTMEALTTLLGVTYMHTLVLGKESIESDRSNIEKTKIFIFSENYSNTNLHPSKIRSETQRWNVLFQKFFL